MKEDVKKEEVGVMVAFLASCPDPVVVSSSHLGVLTCLPLSQQEELLQLVHELLIDSAQSKSLGSLLCSVGQPIIALVQSESTAVRFLAIKVLLTCYCVALLAVPAATLRRVIVQWQWVVCFVEYKIQCASSGKMVAVFLIWSNVAPPINTNRIINNLLNGRVAYALGL